MPKLDRFPPDHDVDQRVELPLYYTYGFPDSRLTAQFVPSSPESALLSLARLQRMSSLLHCQCGATRMVEITIDDDDDDRVFITHCTACGTHDVIEMPDGIQNMYLRSSTEPLNDNGNN